MPVGTGPHTLTLRAVWASYPGAGRAALRGVDLQLTPGRRVALVGPSGAGKSTLADVLVRFLPADAGEATLDGLPLERLAADEVRRVVGLVEQSPHLFDTTLAENLRVGPALRHRRRADQRPDPGRSGPVVVGAARRPRSPQWARTARGCREDNANGSPSPAPCWPTSPSWCSTSPASTSIHRPPTPSPPTCSALTEGRSTLLITHRLTGLEQVDEIVVLDEGRVVERGTHSDLVMAGGRYASLWWDELMNDRPPVEPRSPSAEGDLPAVLKEGSDTP